MKVVSKVSFQDTATNIAKVLLALTKFRSASHVIAPPSLGDHKVAMGAILIFLDLYCFYKQVFHLSYLFIYGVFGLFTCFSPVRSILAMRAEYIIAVFALEIPFSQKAFFQVSYLNVFTESAIDDSLI